MAATEIVEAASLRARTINHPSLKDTAAAYLREQILTGTLRPGTKVDQDEISAALGMSRVPVREALIELAQESLIDAVPRRGAFVARLERGGHRRSLPDLRAHRGTGGESGRLLAHRRAARAAAAHPRVVRRRHRPQDKAQWNHEFHKMINQAGGSRRLASVLRLLSRSLPVRYFEFVPQWADISAQHHARILSALEDTTRTRPSECSSTTWPRAVTSRWKSSRRWATGTEIRATRWKQASPARHKL